MAAGAAAGRSPLALRLGCAATACARTRGALWPLGVSASGGVSAVGPLACLVGDALALASAEGFAVAVTVGEALAVTVGEALAVTVGEALAVTVGEALAVTVGEALGVGVGEALGVGVGDDVAVGVADGDGDGVAVAVDAEGDELGAGDALAGSMIATTDALMTWPDCAVA